MAVAAPRSFAKSTVFSLVYPLWSSLYGKDKDILLVSATGTLSEEWLRRIKDELDNNETIVEDFGNVRSKKWTESHIILSTGCNIRAKGAGYQIRGFRPTTVIADDVEEDEKVNSSDQRKKVEDWFFKSLINTLNPDAKLVIIGTILHPFSLLNNLLINPLPGWVTKRYKAIRDDGTALWPEKWPLSLLDERRNEIGERRFRSEFMNDPLADDDLVFRQEWIEDFLMEKAPENVAMDIITAVDPAISKRQLSDETAIVTIGINRKNGHIYELDSRKGRWSVYETYEQIMKVWRLYKPGRILIEKVAYQQALHEVVLKESRAVRVYLPIREAYPDKDKVRRAQRVSFLFEQGLVHLLRSSKDLISQLTVFPSGEHDDLVDALVYALYEAKEAKAEIIKQKTTVLNYAEQRALKDIMNIERAINRPKKKNWANI